ncbi:hypothetical protein PHLH5_48030 [Pseudomonas sp. Cab53]|nr:hypothetical protein PHLH5_48030 [Pseudomonas sp. Cab53]
MSRYRELAHSHSGGADACYGGESVGLMCLIRLGEGVRNFVFGHNMSKRCMYANQKETASRITESPERAS